MKTYCGKTDGGSPGSQNICQPAHGGWDGQCKDCRIKDLEASCRELITMLEQLNLPQGFALDRARAALGGAQ